MPATVLIVEDEPAILELVAVNLEHAGYETLRARSAEDASRLLSEILPDVVLLDWMLPGHPASRSRAGCAATRARASCRSSCSPPAPRNRTRSRDWRPARTTTSPSPFPRRSWWRASARCCAGASRSTAMTPVDIAGLQARPGGHRVPEREPLAFGPTEFRLLHFLMTHPDRVYTRAQLLDEVWGDHVFIEERTVDVHIRRLRQALSPTGHDALVETVRGSGYALRADTAAAMSRG